MVNQRKLQTIIIISMIIFTIHGIINKTNYIEKRVDQVSTEEDFSKLIPITNVPAISTPIDMPFSGFIQNQGQISDGSIKYYFSTQGMSIGFSTSEIKFVTDSGGGSSLTTFSITFPHAEKITPVGIHRQKNYVNYFYSDFQAANVPTFKEVWYYNLYENIDLRYYMSVNGLKYEFLVHPGADLNNIILQTSNSIQLNVKPDRVAFNTFSQIFPVIQDTHLRVFQFDGTEIPATFLAKSSNSYGYLIDTYDSSQVLVIDPLVLSYSTFLGGNDNEYPAEVVVDQDNNAYICGYTYSINFPSVNAFESTHNGSQDAFITKLNTTGTGIVFSSFLGGSSYDTADGLSIDSNNNIYLSGTTGSDNFPTYKGLNASRNGGDDGFIAKLNSTGNGLIFSTYLGGSSNENTVKIAVDSYDNIYVAGTTFSANFPKVNAFDTVIAGGSEAFVTKLNATGTGLIFSSYLGGDGQDYFRAIAIDAYNNTYLTGDTYSSTDFPLVNAINDTLSGPKDYFVSKINAAGNGLVFSTYLGGNNYDNPTALAVDIYNNSYICGTTNSADYPLVNAYDSSFDGLEGFITKLNSTGTGFVFSTLFGGNFSDIPNDIVVDVYNNTYIVGTTRSYDLPTVNAYDSSNNGGLNDEDAFITKFNSSGNGLIFSTYLGGSEDDEGKTITIDEYNNSYIAGFTESSDFPTYRAANDTYGGTEFYTDVFVTKFTIDEILPSITLASHQNNSIYPSGILVNIAVFDEYLDTVWYNWDDNTNQTWNEPYQTPLPTGEGTHWLHVYANDTAGHLVSQIYSFITDDIDPVIILEYPANNTNHNSGTLIDLSVTEIHLDVLRYYWDIGPYQLLEPPYQTPLPAGDGIHTLYLLAIDSAGNGVSMDLIFTTDDTNPVVEISSPNDITYTSNSVTLTYTISEGVTTIFLNGVANTTALPSGNVLTSLPEGENNITIVAVDTAGNSGQMTIVFTVDTTITTTTTTPSDTSTTTTTAKGGYFPGFTLITLALLVTILGYRKRPKKE